MASLVSQSPKSLTQPFNGLPDESPPRTACLFNLVVFCRRAERIAYFKKLIQAAIEHFPCRVMFIQDIHGEAQKLLSTELTVLKAKQSDNPVNCDQLLIETGSHTLAQVPFVLLPFILPDLPLFLIWDCDPTTEQEILPKLLPHANRLIFDSETIDHLQRFAHRILAYQGSQSLDMVDLNWTRIGGWRDLMSKMFDTEERIGHLQNAQEFHIAYNGMEDQFFHHNQTQAIYLQAWLAAQLGWNFCSMGGSRGKSEIRYSTDRGKTRVSLQAIRVEDRAPGSIFSIELIAARGVRLLASRQSGTQQVIVKTSSDLSCTLPYTLNLRGTQLTYAFLKDALYLYTSPHYQHMLHMLKQQDWNSES